MNARDDRSRCQKFECGRIRIKMRRTSQRGRDTAEDRAANTDRRMAKRNKHQTHKLAHQIQ
ncbi:hypothetical protein A9F13_01g06908 [Clavispora lusitaniae]|uniref:Uncharacterized protein n=1 Tax=Clavispora lusitaniae TaxID=36911 RepID=A0AA91Q4Q6_CLALS|nr:hypothetical protein A9F13_01g06908 [Clavispora lusitaniae]